MNNPSEVLAETIEKTILANFLDYVKIFTPVQSNFLFDLNQRYRCLDSGNIVLCFAQKTHRAILRKKDYDLNYDLSFDKFWQNHETSKVEKTTILDIAKITNLPKETTRRKLLELTKQKVFIKKNRFISWLPNEEYKKDYNKTVMIEIKKIAKLTKYVTDKVNLNFSDEEILNEYRNKFSFYWFHYLNLQIKWMGIWKKQLGDLEIVLILMQIASLLSSRVSEEVSHEKLFSEPTIINKPNLQNLNVSVSATSLSDITGISRATCIRKLNLMVQQKLVRQDENSKRFYIIPAALNKTLISKEVTAKVTKLFSEFYFIVIKALSIKTTH